MGDVSPSRKESKLRFIYRVNLAILGAVLLICLIPAIKDGVLSSDPGISFWDAFGLTFFLLYAFLAWPAFMLFLVLNIWMLVIRRDRRWLFATVSLLLGVLNAYFGYSSVDWFLHGFPFP